MSFTTPPSGSERLGPGKSSTDRVWLLQFEPDGAGAGFWGFSGLLGKMLGFRFLLGIFVIFSPGVVLSFGGGEMCSWVRWKDGASSMRFPSLRDFLRVALFLDDFPSLVFETSRKEKSNLWNSIDVFLPQSLSPDNLAVMPTFSWELSWLWLRPREEGCYLSFPLGMIFFFLLFFFSFLARSFYQFLLDNSWVIWASDGFNTL